jgi:hypothetical protein
LPDEESGCWRPLFLHQQTFIRATVGSALCPQTDRATLCGKETSTGRAKLSAHGVEPTFFVLALNSFMRLDRETVGRKARIGANLPKVSHQCTVVLDAVSIDIRRRDYPARPRRPIVCPQWTDPLQFCCGSRSVNNLEYFRFDPCDGRLKISSETERRHLDDNFPRSGSISAHRCPTRNPSTSLLRVPWLLHSQMRGGHIRSPF